MSWGPAVETDIDGASHASPSDTLWVRTEYDEEGATRSVSRRSQPDRAGGGAVTTQWRYDILGRAVAEIAPDGARDVTVYDHAGNVVERIDRRGLSVHTEYDVLGRPERRIVDRVAYESVRTPIEDENGFELDAWRLPMYVDDGTGALERTPTADSDSLVFASETATFAYDIAGNVIVADNPFAQVRRAYDAAGRLVSDTLRVRTVADLASGGGFGQHEYVLGYEYDLNGRRTALLHPTDLQPYGGTTPKRTRYTYAPVTGELERITDPRGFTYVWTYDAQGRPETFTRGGAVETYRYDAYGRRDRREETSGGQSIHDDRFTHDARGKLTAVTTLDQYVTNAYTGLGALSRTFARGVAAPERKTDERYFVDALNNTIGSRTDRVGQLQGIQYGSQPDTTVRMYEAGTGRLAKTLSAPGSDILAQDTTLYDAAGNRILKAGRRITQTPYPVGDCSTSVCSDGDAAMLFEELREWYDAAGQLRLVDRRTCLIYDGVCDTERVPLPSDRAAFEEYRYDALGRRVWMRTRQEWRCLERCRTTVRRVVWDGDQILYEIQAPGGTDATAAQMEADVGLAAAVPTFSYDSRTVYDFDVEPPASDSTVTPANGADGFYYGRVLYTHGGGIDAPLSVTRMEYSDSLSAPMTVFLHRDWRGTHDLGTYEGGGTRAPCVPITVTKFLQEPAEGQEPGTTAPSGGGTSYHCWDVDWPAPHVEITGRTYERSLVGAVGWSGSQIDAMRDASGLMYRRNRYYDPASGRFTQEDPIGLAGGLNVYGFAAGDPVSYSDPYGLCPIPPAFILADGPQPGPADAAVVLCYVATGGALLAAMPVVSTLRAPEIAINISFATHNGRLLSRLEGEFDVIEAHFDKLDGRGPPGSGDPRDPNNRKKWKDDIMRHVDQARRLIQRMRGRRNKEEPLQQVQEVVERLSNY